MNFVIILMKKIMNNLNKQLSSKSSRLHPIGQIFEPSNVNLSTFFPS